MRRVLNENINPARSIQEVQDYFAPEVYIAKPQGETVGIPGLVDGKTFDVSSDDQPDRPGVARCDIYRVRPATGSTDEELVPIGLSKWVYNLSHDDVASGKWLTVHRDKFGNWIVAEVPKEKFLAVIMGRMSFEMEPEGSSGGGTGVPRLRGEYTWAEVIAMLEADPVNFGRVRLIHRIKPGGRFGYAGRCDALHEVNRSNAAAEVQWEQSVDDPQQGFITEVTQSLRTECVSSDQESSWEFAGSYTPGISSDDPSTSSNYFYTCDFKLPREDEGVLRANLANLPVNDSA